MHKILIRNNNRYLRCMQCTLQGILHLFCAANETQTLPYFNISTMLLSFYRCGYYNKKLYTALKALKSLLQ